MAKAKFSQGSSARSPLFDCPDLAVDLQGVPYSVRESDRAKNVSIKVARSGAIELVVPVGFSRRRLSEIVQDRRDWIAKTLHRLELERQSLPQELISPCPEKIVLGAIPEIWTVRYQPMPRGRLQYRTAGAQQLLIEGNVGAIAPCQDVLRQWLAARARAYLPEWLRRVSQDIGLPCNTIVIRKQRTLWASCSSKKNISLNYKLLFLPPHLVRYIFVHELCHTVHMNHSHRFWRLVSEIDPNYEWKDQELRQAWKYVPQWVDDML